MQLSELLLEKLNSDVILSKRIQLAQNAFISVDLRIAYKEEYILTWFLQNIIDIEDEEGKKQLINGFCFCINSEVMTHLPASAVRVNVKSNISKLLVTILKRTDTDGSNLTDSVFLILKKFSLHYKSHSKQYVKIMYALLKLQLPQSQISEILSLSSDIFKSGALHEKFVTQLLQKDFHLLFKNEDVTDLKNNVVIQFIQKMLFKKEVFHELEIILHSICSGHKMSGNNPIILATLSSLHNVYTAKLDIKIKIQVFSKVFEAFARCSSNDESVSLLQFFVLLCHLIGLEQSAVLKPTLGQPGKSAINESYFQEVTHIPSVTATESSYVIVNQLIGALSSHSPNLSATLFDSYTYLQWFQSFVLGAVAYEELSHVHLDFFCACANFNTSVFEKNFAKVYSHLLKQSENKFEDDDFKNSYKHFMENMLTMYSKLQRIQKFILKLLQSVRNTKSILTLKNIFPDNFMLEFSNLITLMPSIQSISFMDDLVTNLNEHCVKILEAKNEPVKVLFIQSTCALLAAFLCGVRVLSHMTPQKIVKSFIEKSREIKEILGRFGKALLVRIHDRDIVQPFLNLSFFWGEIELLIMCYVEEHALQLTNKDISAADLSTLHSYLSGEEWNVLAERVSNFGAEQCYKLFLKLILQKIRTLQLKNCSLLINGEATSKHILTQLTSELYKHNIIEELTPEDVVNLLNYLPQKQSCLFLEKFYTQVIEAAADGEKVLHWIKDSVLLEKQNFVILSLVVILQKISSKLNKINRCNGASGVPFKALALDFVDEDYKINHNEYVKLVNHVNELLNSGTDFSLDNSVKLAHMKILVDIMRCLPLVYMSLEVSLLALSGLTFLAVLFSSTEELLKPLLHLIYNLAPKINKSNTISCFNVGLFIKWLLYADSQCEAIRQLKSNLVKLLLKISPSRESGLSELEELVNFIQKKKLKQDPKSLENQILLYQDLGKTWMKTRKQNLTNDEISRFRKKLSKRIRKELERQIEMEAPTADCEVLVTAYSIELTRVVKLKNKQNVVGLIKLNFDKFFDLAVSKVQNGSAEESYITFLTTVLIHLPDIKDLLNKPVLKTIWNALKSRPKVDWKLFYRTADPQEFEFILSDLIKTWQIFTSGKNNDLVLENYFYIWKEFYDIDLHRKKKLYEAYLKRLFIHFSADIAVMNNFTPEQMVQLYNFIRFCISTSDIMMTSTMLDSSIDIMCNYDYKETLSVKDFQKVFESCINAASWSLTTRSVRMKDKIHNLFQLFVKLLDALGKKSNAKLYTTEEELLSLSSCAHNMEKWTSKMVQYSKDFSRMSVYFIAAVVSTFVKINIYPAVKAPLVNCIHNFLSISDSHNISHLLRVFNPGSQQVFNGIYETYKKYYKYTGKV